MDIAILIGGEGSRIKKISKTVPKPFLKIGNKSIIDHQLKFLSKIKKKIFLLSNRKYSRFHHQLKQKYKNIKFEIFEETMPLGTGGCLKSLSKYKNNDYLIVYGDLIFNINFKKFYNFHKKNKSDLTFLVHPNDHPFDSDLLEINKKNQLTNFHKKPHKKNNIGNLSLSGILIISKKIIKYIKPKKFQDLSKDILPKLLKKRLKIYAYNTREYVKDVGTPKRIKLVKNQIKTKKFINGNINKKLPAIFLDRDGVINKEYPNQHYQNPMEINQGAVSAIKKINKNGYLSVIVTNQPAVAKGVITIDKLENDHKKFKKKSTWRKPNNGMLLQAIKDLNIDVKKSYMIGDQSVDYYAAKKTGIKCLIVGKKFITKGIKNYKNLYDATKVIF